MNIFQQSADAYALCTILYFQDEAAINRKEKWNSFTKMQISGIKSWFNMDLSLLSEEKSFA